MDRKKNYIERNCKFCKTLFSKFLPPSDIKQGSKGWYCSRSCSNRANAKHLSKIRRGKNNPSYGKKPWNYIDGKSRTERNTYEYWNWRRKVFNRDKNICQGCYKKFKRKELTAHHIKPWSTHKELRYEVDNGLTYCRSCHNKNDPLIRATQF